MHGNCQNRARKQLRHLAHPPPQPASTRSAQQRQAKIEEAMAATELTLKEGPMPPPNDTISDMPFVSGKGIGSC